MQFTAPASSAYSPLWHSKHAEDSSLSLYVPTEQLRQAVLRRLSSLCVPAAQTSHSIEAFDEACLPLGQSSHVTDPSGSLVYVSGAQCSHELLPIRPFV